MSSMPDDDAVELLLSYTDLLQRAMQLIAQADSEERLGRLRDADAAHTELASVLRRQLSLAARLNEISPQNPFDLSTIVGPLLNSLTTRADIVEALGELELAERLRDEALAVAAEYLPETALAEQERQRAASLLSQGRFNEALTRLSSARDRFEQEGSTLEVATVAASIANILEWLSDFGRMREEAARALRLIEPLLPKDGLSTSAVLAAFASGQHKKAETLSKLQEIVSNLQQIAARANRSLGNYTEAERQFREVMPLVPDFAHPAIGFQLAAIRLGAGQAQEALDAFDALKPAFTGLLRPKLGVLLKYRADALLALGRTPEALTAVDASLNELEQQRDPDALWKAQWTRARVLEALGRGAEALEAYTATAATINGLRRAPLGYRLDSTYILDKLPLFADAIGLAARQAQAAVACRLMEMVKSRALVAALSTPARGDRDPLSQQVDKLSRQIDLLEYKGYQEGWAEELETQRAALLAQRAAVLEQIRFSDPRWRSLSAPVPFDLPTTLERLAARKQAALTLFYEPERVTAVLLKDRQCTIETLPLSDAARRGLDQYQADLRASPPKPQAFDPSTGLGLLADQLIPAALLEQALASAGCVIIPHGPLHLIPWAGMSYRSKRLFETCPISILPNLSCLLSLQTEPAEPSRIALIGAPDTKGLSLAPLRFAPHELATLEEIYSAAAGTIGEVLSGPRATEAAFWELAGRPDAEGAILHIACHATFETGDPLNSGLLLTDGRVDASEIESRTVYYHEVVLSACNTG